jgi:hypothetical protein
MLEMFPISVEWCIGHLKNLKTVSVSQGPERKSLS